MLWQISAQRRNLKNYHYILLNMVGTRTLGGHARTPLQLSRFRHSLTLFWCARQGFVELNLTEFHALTPNVTGFQLVNWSDPAVLKVQQDWLNFDPKDGKAERRALRV